MKKYLIILFLFVTANVFTQDIDILEEPISIAEEMPIYKGCTNLNKEDANLCTNRKIVEYAMTIPYPAEYSDIDIEGKIYLSFVVETDCSITNVILLRGFDRKLDKAAIEHIKKMPKFETPGFLNGKAVRIKYNLPININLG